MGYNRSRPIPGVTGKRIPGNARTPTMRGRHMTNVPFQMGSGGNWGSAIFREYHRQQVRDSHGRFAGGWGFAWQGAEMVADNLEQWEHDTLEGLKQAAESLKDEMVAYMQANAPWSDETGNARRELQGVVVWEDDAHFTIMLGHGKDIYYGIWLEVRWGGRYAIVLPTVMQYAPVLAEKIRTMT